MGDFGYRAGKTSVALRMEDYYVWDCSVIKSGGKYHMFSSRITKDDVKNGSYGVTGEWGAGFYAESDDCMDFTIGEDPKVYSRQVTWEDGSRSLQCNLERPSLLFDENGEPTHIFCASGTGPYPYSFQGVTYIVCMKLEKK